MGRQMIDIKYNYLKYREKLILRFWNFIPNSILYWAVNEAWARATSLEFTNKTPAEIDKLKAALGKIKSVPQSGRDDLFYVIAVEALQKDDEVKE